MPEQSFMKAMFHGVISEELVFPFPEMASTERENVAIVTENVRRFLADQVDSAAIDRGRTIPPEVFGEAKALGLFGLGVPAELGGIGLSTSACSRVMQEISSWDASLAVVLEAHQSIGYQALLLFGTPEQQHRYLPSLASGEKVAAFALTEATAGSDAAAIRTRAELAPDGSQYVLSGTKTWVTNGGIADAFTVFARTAHEQEPSKPHMVALFVERGEGVSSGPEEDKLGVRGSSTTSVSFDDVRVPVANVLGEPGSGFKIAMEVLNAGRLGLAARCVGSCRMLLKLAIERVAERRAFGRNIGEFGMVKDKIGAMLAATYALESMTYLTTGLVDARIPDFSLESAICKVFGSETLSLVAQETLQLAAGLGYLSEYPYERMLRDARFNLIFEGTNEILRCFIALAGMASPGAKTTEIAQAIREPIMGIGLLKSFAMRKARSMLVPERAARVHPILSREAVALEEGASQLAGHVENVLRKHGADIAHRQFAMRRVADVAIDLYALAACLSRTTLAVEQLGDEAAHRQISYTRVFARQAAGRLRRNLAAFEDNDDELRKATAERAYADGRYAVDVL